MLTAHIVGIPFEELAVSYARGLDVLLNTFNYLDLTPLGRQYHIGQAVHHDMYETAGTSTGGHC